MLSENLPRPGKSSDVCETPEVFGDIICVHTKRNSLLQVDAILVIIGVVRLSKRLFEAWRGTSQRHNKIKRLLMYEEMTDEN